MTEDLRVIEGGLGAPNAVVRTARIVGFKSFMNKTTIEFAPGITAIIGPNGSGKSVLGESIRWVLAETNPRHLRAKKGEELIFGGSETKRSLGMAEVLLHIDNTSRRLPIDLTEVEIGRRVYRNGESEYLINGAHVHLRDGTNLHGGAVGGAPVVGRRGGRATQGSALGDGDADRGQRRRAAVRARRGREAAHRPLRRDRERGVGPRAHRGDVGEPRGGLGRARPVA